MRERVIKILTRGKNEKLRLVRCATIKNLEDEGKRRNKDLEIKQWRIS